MEAAKVVYQQQHQLSQKIIALASHPLRDARSDDKINQYLN